MSTIASRFRVVHEKVVAAAENAGRNPDTVTLIAVSKTWAAPVLLEAYKAGVRHFGENRAEELAEKRTFFENELGMNNDITWHFIGNPQSRKTVQIADHADMFHALDRVKIARRLSNRLCENNRFLPVLLEVNVSGETSKAGLNCTDWENDMSQQQAVVTFVETVAGMSNLSIQGLMTMAPWGSPAPEIANIFHRTHALAAWLKVKMPAINWSHLSMGMTNDYPLAIAKGATYVRVGRAIFGSR